jgi:hypothetical protein
MTVESAWGVISVDATISGDRSTASTTVATPAFSTASGNELLLAFIASDYRSGTNTTVKSISGAGLTWVLVVRTNVQSGTAEIWRAFASLPLSSVSVTATLSQSVASSITVMSFAGVDTSGTNGSGAVGATAGANGPSGAPTASLVTTRANSWVFGAGNDFDNAIGRTPGTGQRLVHQYLATVGDTYWVQMQNGPTAASGTRVTINDTVPTTDRYNLSICEVLPSTSGGTQTWSISGTISPVSAGSGATVTLSGAAAATTTADGSGNFSFTGLANGGYSVTPSRSGYTFTPASQSVTVSGANLTGISFTGQPVPTTWSISGTISPVSAGSGATVTLGGAAAATATADGSGNFSFTGLANGSYSVTPSRSGYTFTPASRAVTVSGANQTGINFTGQPVPTTWSISGTISPVSAGSGATVTLSGAAAATTTADGSGNFSFTGLANGSYSVTPSRSGYTFTPASRAVTVNGANQTGIGFTGQPVSNSISIDATISGDRSSAGTTVTTPSFSTAASNELLLAFIASDYQSGSNTTVTGVSGAGLTWVLVVRTNVQSGTAEIWRAFASVPLSNVSVTATLSQSVASSITVMSFSGVDTSGTNGSGAIGASAGASGSSGAPTASLVTTRSNSWVFGVGNDFDNAIGRTLGAGQSLVHQYLASVGDTYWVQMQSSPTATDGTRVTINDTAPTGDRYNLSICEVLPATSGGGSPPSYSISGTISPPSGGSGSTLALSGAANATTVADASGAYLFGGLVSGAYTVTPSRQAYSFNPAAQAVSINAANVAGVNFTATPLSGQTFGISGTISPPLGGGGATVTLGAAANATTTASASGAYSFSGLANGTYTVTPSNPGFTFTPPVQSVVINGASVSAVNFVAGAGYMISGTLSPAANGVGATVALTGSVNASTTVTGSGTFTFTGLPPGYYTVTPSRTNATFSPLSQSVSIASENVGGVDFTASSTENIIFFDNFSQPALSSDWTVISRHGEYAQSETECNIPQQVSAGSGLTITTAAQTWTCGDFNIDGSTRHAPSAWPYITGDVQWTSKNFTYGTVEARAKFPAQATSLWPAIWMLGSNCQVTNIYTADTGYSTCSGLGEDGYVEADMVECYGSGWCQFHVANPSFGIGGGCDAVYSVDTNWHTFTTVWTAASIKQYMDGVLETTCTHSINSPMFLIIQTQTGGVGGTPNNAALPAQLMVDYVKVTQP